MKKTVVFLTLISFLLPVDLMASGRRPSSKPGSPVKISIVPVQEGLTSSDIRPGDIVDLDITAVSFIDADRMDIEIRMSGGVEFLSGETEWSGPVRKGEENILTISIRSPLKGAGKVKARAVIPLSRGTSFSASASFRLGPAVKDKPEPPPPVKKDGKGRNIIEYRLKKQ